uniref:BolA-like protein n=1 Tax=Romanomermis culicivorax TaxID=13658 RepID=A0A915K8R4_ROMCU
MVERSIVEEKLRQQLAPDYLEITDISDGCGAKYDIVVVSKHFEGKPLLQRHRLVNETLAEEMKSIHALTMKTLTPNQWDVMKLKNA